MRTVMRSASVQALAAAGLLSAGVARAQVADSAEALWERGKADMLAGNLATGCPAIEESYRLDPQPGALFVSAACHAQWGKVLAAVARYEAYLALEPQLSQSEHGPRLARARAEVQRLKPSIPRLQLVLASAQAADVSIALDGATLAPEKLGSLLLVEVGVHRIETRRAAGVPWRVELTLAPGEIRRVELEVPDAPASPLAGVASAPTRVEPAAPAAQREVVPASAPTSTPLASVDAAPSSNLSTFGWVAGGVGMAGVILGSVAGALVLHQKGIVEDECERQPDATGQRACSSRGWKAVERGDDWGTVATVSFGVGLAGLAAGAVLLLMDAPSTRAGHAAAWRPTLQVDTAGAWLGISETR